MEASNREADVEDREADAEDGGGDVTMNGVGEVGLISDGSAKDNGELYKLSI